MSRRPCLSIALAAVLTLVLSASIAHTRVPTGGNETIRIADDQRLPVARRGPGDLAGTVTVAGEGVPGWSVSLYEASPSGAMNLANTTTDDEGKFQFRRSPQWADANLYVIARRDSEARLLALLGRGGEFPLPIVVNELSTIASVWAAAQFLDGMSIAGNAVGLTIAARNVPNLVDLATGGLGAVITNQVNGTRTNTLATLNTLASLLTDCIQKGCPGFYPLATLPGEPDPTDTLEAFGNVARNPWNNVVDIFKQRPPANADIIKDRPYFLPTLLWAPTAWTLSIVHTNGGFQAPGEISIDQEGNVWSNNNFMPGSQSILFPDGDPGVVAYDGIAVTKLSSNGRPLSPQTGFIGGGTFGSAFATAVDAEGNAWFGNAGGNSISKFAPDGTPLSPDSRPQYSRNGGLRTHPELDFPQSIAFDLKGDLWVTNLMGNSVTQLIGGDPERTNTWGGEHCEHKLLTPWGVATDGDGNIWITNYASNTASMIDPSSGPPYCPTMNYRLGADGVLEQPDGIAVDSRGNVWVAKLLAGKITLLEKSIGYAPPQVFDGNGSVHSPWGLVVDGADNVWAADFFRRRVLHLCGKGGNCPPGFAPGDNISPGGEGGGYGANGSLQSLTGIQIDQAGNVWAVNNFQSSDVCLGGAGLPPASGVNTVALERLQTQCGGNGLVQILGAAAPTKAPVIGPAGPPD